MQRSLFHACVCRATQVQRKVWQEVQTLNLGNLEAFRGELFATRQLRNATYSEQNLQH